MVEREVMKEVPLEEITPNPENPRINEEAIKEVIKSIEASEFISPIIVDEENKILAGNTRYKALQKMSKPKAPLVVRVTGLTEEQKKRFILADNKTQEFSVWDWEKLGIFGEEMLKEVGFSEDEIEAAVKTGTEPKDDVIPENVPAVAKMGEVWLLGEGKLMCGDSTSRQDIDKLMAGNKAVLGFTSPPYWVGKEYETQKSVEEIDNFIGQICEQYAYAVQKDFSRIVINTGTGFTTSFEKKKKRQVLLLIDKWADNFFLLGWNLRHVRHWLKEGQLASTSPKSDLIDQHCEFLGTFENDEGQPIKFEDVLLSNEVGMLETFYHRDGQNAGQRRTGRKWALRSYWDDIKGTAGEAKHCASFPVELVLRHLMLYTRKDELVLDLFAGAGTTFIACEISRRKCYGMEIDPQYTSIALERWAQHTGRDPIRESDGKPWSLVKGE